MKIKNNLIKAAVMVAIAGSASAAPTNDEIMQMMQELKSEIADLKQENRDLKGDVEDVYTATEEGMKAQVELANKTTIGGYGELHHNRLEGHGGASDVDKMDFHRFVLFFNHQFSDRLRLVSELELEHALVKDIGDASHEDNGPGEIELEQAYIEYDINDKVSASAGLFLIPVGILNETHEPDTFYGVERNPVEKNIIPTTWWAGGVMGSFQLADGLQLRVAAHEGLEATSSFKPRDGRQKTANAVAEDYAYTANLRYTAIPGVTLGGTVNYQADFAQQTGLAVEEGILVEGHAIIEMGKFGLRALYADWKFTGAGPEANGRDSQVGGYIEPSYRVNDKFGVFARYSSYDNEDGNSTASRKTQSDVGFNYYLDPQVVLKADYQSQSNDSGSEQKGINVGMGYSF
jgi:outer membrane murein-binding lipoprotein Lpp